MSVFVLNFSAAVDKMKMLYAVSEEMKLILCQRSVSVICELN